MLTNYYTFQALVHEWRPDLIGALVSDVYSQVRGELTVACSAGNRDWSLRFSVQAPQHYVMRSEGFHRARRNVADLFPHAKNRSVEDIVLADRDRILFVKLEGGVRIQVNMYGPQANIFLAGADGRIIEAFQNNDEWAGKPEPEIQPALKVESFCQFRQRWKADYQTNVKALSSAIPLFDRLLATEALFRAGVDVKAEPDETSADALKRIYEYSQSLQVELKHPRPTVYRNAHFVQVFSLIQLRHLTELEKDSFDTVDLAVRTYVRRFLGQQRLLKTATPILKALERAVKQYRRQVDHASAALTRMDRADRHERAGHLLMAAASSIPPGASEVDLPDLFGDQRVLTIPLSDQLSAVENAEAYYEKARRSRVRQERTKTQLGESIKLLAIAEDLLGHLRQIHRVADLVKFKKEHSDTLDIFIKTEEATWDRIPFLRFQLEQGFEVWAGKNAKQNDILTFRYAKKYDVWMHARGVKGSHVIVRVPDKNRPPGKKILEEAASIAAYYSKLRGSDLVPVIVCERKYVRKPRGGHPGMALVERENVLLVQPRLPAERS